MRNVHARTLNAPSDALAALIERLAGPSDVLWPGTVWPPMRLDRPLGVGATGGHGPIRYHVTEYEPGRRVHFAFDRSRRLDGFHEFRIESLPDGRSRVVHVLEGRVRGRMRWQWLVVVRWLHDALVEDAFDNAERFATGSVAAPARWSPWVRILRSAVLAVNIAR